MFLNDCHRNAMTKAASPSGVELDSSGVYLNGKTGGKNTLLNKLNFKTIIYQNFVNFTGINEG